MQETVTLKSSSTASPPILRSQEFQDLVRKKTRFSLGLTLITMLVYFGFLFMVAFKKNVLSILVTDNIPLGIPLGISVILLSCLITGVYVYWANKFYDPAIAAIKNKLGEK